MGIHAAPQPNNISNLILQLKKFQPLVNESGVFEGKFKPHDEVPIESIPDRDQLLNSIGMAIMDMQAFIKAHKSLQEKHRELVTDSMMAHQAMQGLGINVHSLAEGFEGVCGRHRQALDVLDEISKLTPDSDVATRSVTMARSFMDHLHKRIQEAENTAHKILVNENPDVNENTPSSAPVQKVSDRNPAADEAGLVDPVFKVVPSPAVPQPPVERIREDRTSEDNDLRS